MFSSLEDWENTIVELGNVAPRLIVNGILQE